VRPDFRGQGNVLGAAVQLGTLPWLGLVPDEVASAPRPRWRACRRGWECRSGNFATPGDPLLAAVHQALAQSTGRRAAALRGLDEGIGGAWSRLVNGLPTGECWAVAGIMLADGTPSAASKPPRS